MLSILDKYIAREVLQTFLGVTLVLMLIFLSKLLVGYLAEAASGEIPSDLILALMTLKSLKYLTLILPLSLFLAILLVQGRMYSDSEMVAITACGIGTLQLYKPLFFVAIPVVLILTGLSLYALPWTERLEDTLLSEAQKNLEVTGIQAGRFREGASNERIIYTEEISSDRSLMKNLFIYTRKGDRQILLSSKKGRLELDEKTNDRYLLMLDGTRYEGTPGDADYKIIKFKEHSLLIKPGVTATGGPQRNALATKMLWNSDDKNHIAELQWRISMPLSALVLVLLALPLGKVDPRKGRYGKLFIAILLYIFYVNLLAVAQSWTIKGEISTSLGIWWVHGVVLLLVAILLVRRNGMRWTIELLRDKVRAA